MKFKLFTIIALLLFVGVSFAGEQLIAEWLVNEGSGTTAYCSPESYDVADAVLNGTQNWTTDENGTWFNFTGGQTFQANYDSFPLDLTKSFKIKFDFWAGGNSGILSNDTIGWGAGAFNIIKQNGVIVLQQHSGGVAFSSIYLGDCDKDGDGVIGDDWYSVEVSYNSSNGAVGFVIDGVTDTGVTYYGGGTSVSLINSAARTNVVLGWHSIDYLRLVGGLRNVQVYQTLSKPTTPSPYNGQAAVVPGDLTLSWDDSYGNYTAGYNVYLSAIEDDVINRTVTPIAVSTSSADVNVDSDSVYYWAVDGDASDPNNTVGDTWSFQTQGVKPYNLLPADAAMDVSIFATLSWTEDATVDSYKVYITDNQDELDNVTPIDTTNTEISFDADALELHRWYYWKVAALIEGQEFDSFVSSFQTTGNEILDAFDYGSNTAIQAAWVLESGTGQISWISRDYDPYYNPSMGNISYNTEPMALVMTLDSAKDFTTASNVTLRVFHESNSQANSASFTLSLLNGLGSVIYEDSYTPGDVLSDDDTFHTKEWYRWIMPLSDIAGMDAVEAVKITVDGMPSSQWLFIDDLTITVPQCDGDMFGDAYGDCQIDIRDFAVIAGSWLGCNRIPAESCDEYFYEVFEEIE